MRRKKRKNGKIIFGILIIAALSVAGFFCYEYFFKPKEENKPTTPSQTVTPTPVENPDNGRGETPEKPLEKEPVVQYDGNNPNEAASLTGVVTYAGATDSNVIIRVNIDQYVDGGSCNLSLYQNGNAVYQAGASLIADVSTSTCDGFNIPRSSIYNAGGTYEIVINLFAGDKKGTIKGEVSL